MTAEDDTEFERVFRDPAHWRDHEQSYRAAGLFNRALAMQRWADTLEQYGRHPMQCEWLDAGVFEIHGAAYGFDPLPFEHDSVLPKERLARQLAQIRGAVPVGCEGGA